MPGIPRVYGSRQTHVARPGEPHPLLAGYRALTPLGDTSGGSDGEVSPLNAAVPMAAPVDDLTGPRQESWTCTLLTRYETMRWVIDQFTGGSLEQNANRSVRGGGSVEMTFASSAAYDKVDWGSDRLLIQFTVNGQVWPMGVYLVSAPESNYDDNTGEVQVSVKVLDKLSILEQDQVDGSFSLPKGTVALDAVRQQIQAVGETRIAFTEATTKTRVALTWEAGTSRLTIVNDLLSSIGYESLWCDGSGVFRARPYVDPQERPTVYSFVHGEQSLHVPQWTRSQDWYETPNKVVMIAQGDDETPPLVSIQTNENPESPYSYQARGRWIVHTETGVEAADQAALDNLAKMRMGSYASVVSNIAVEHAMLNLLLEDRVEMQTPEHTLVATISSMSYSLEPASLCSAQWSEVIFT